MVFDAESFLGTFDNESFLVAFDEAFALSKALISVPSVTPASMDSVRALQEALGPEFWPEYFVLQHMDSKNDSLTYGAMFSYMGKDVSGKSLCFAGHLDVVPPGTGWDSDPFDPIVINDTIVGRGAVDMKSAIACFVAAAHKAIQDGIPLGRISLLLSGDEESSRISSMGRIVDILMERDLKFDLCIVGEPTSSNKIGDTLKIGRRGSCNFELTIEGRQGHAAYVDSFDNPIDRIPDVLRTLKEIKLDSGTENFQPSMLVVTDVSTNNSASRNVVPAQARIMFNIRFNDSHNPESLYALIKEELDKQEVLKYDLEYYSGASPFFSGNNDYVPMLKQVVSAVTGIDAELSTSGGTSDARFLHKIAPTIELGLLSGDAHAVNESVSLEDLRTLTKIYYGIIYKTFCD